MKQHWLSFLTEARAEDHEPAGYICKEFERFVNCGVLARGFVRLRCQECGLDELVAFSCKKRGFCPSCCGRRMNEGAAFLVDHVLPRTAYRQWVLSMPMPLRYWMARNPRLITQVLAIFHRVMSRYYRSKAAALSGGQSDALTGAVTVVQRFGSALNLNIHFHVLMPDGVFNKTTGEFFRVKRPDAEEICRLLEVVQRRVLRALKRRGLIDEGDDQPHEAEQTLDSICQSASIVSHIATGKRAGRPVRRVGSFGGAGERAQVTSKHAAALAGFSLHAGTFVHENNRAELERLCRYILRPPISERRIEITGDQVLYHLKSRWSDGTTAIKLSGTEFIEKLVALIPQPRIHLTRFHGVLAPNAKLRGLVVPGQAVPVLDQATLEHGAAKKTPSRLRFSELLRRVFRVDLEICTKCGGRVRMIAAIEEETVAEAILINLGLPTIALEFEPP